MSRSRLLVVPLMLVSLLVPVAPAHATECFEVPEIQFKHCLEP